MGLWYGDIKGFLSTPSARRATSILVVISVADFNFYPRPPRGGRLAGRYGLRDAHSISIHALREEGDNDVVLIHHDGNLISIHALREEGDFHSTANLLFCPCISIHALREEGDSGRMSRGQRPCTFLSTPSARRATSYFRGRGYITQISIHALREEGDWIVRHPAQGHAHFYPRPPRGGRQGQRDIYASRLAFLSTPSARRATEVLTRSVFTLNISIHALREEGDPLSPGRYTARGNISIHALREEGDLVGISVAAHLVISIHALREEGDKSSRRYSVSTCISIHALREEGDYTCFIQVSCNRNFYPRPPRGGRPFPFLGLSVRYDISIHALREEGDSRSIPFAHLT